MHVSLAEAQASLPDLVRRAEAGEEVVLTNPGRPNIRLVPDQTDDWRERRERALDEFTGILKGRPGFEMGAANVDKELYDDRGCPK